MASRFDSNKGRTELLQARRGFFNLLGVCELGLSTIIFGDEKGVTTGEMHEYPIGALEGSRGI